jgi:hypothetical protein
LVPQHVGEGAGDAFDQIGRCHGIAVGCVALRCGARLVGGGGERRVGSRGTRPRCVAHSRATVASGVPRVRGF